jgi:hypothetical protein
VRTHRQVKRFLALGGDFSLINKAQMDDRSNKAVRTGWGIWGVVDIKD